MKARWIRVALALLALGPGWVAAQGLPPGLRHDEYRFIPRVPGQRLATFGWQRFANERGSTVLVSGLRGVESHALAVVRLPEPAAEGASALDVARRERPSVGAAMRMADDGLPCAVMPSHEPVPLGDGLLLVLAVCVNPSTRVAYDLSISLQSMALRVRGWPQTRADERACAAEPGRRCRDTDAEMRAAMAALLASWRFPG